MFRELSGRSAVAASLVRSLFCGLPRQDRRMAVVFVSGSDESAGRDQRCPFHYGGFVAPEEDWSRWVAPAWQERVLDGCPQLEFLHLTEMQNPKGRAKLGIDEI